MPKRQGTIINLSIIQPIMCLQSILLTILKEFKVYGSLKNSGSQPFLYRGKLLNSLNFRGTPIFFYQVIKGEIKK